MKSKTRFGHEARGHGDAPHFRQEIGEFSRVLEVEDIPAGGLDLTIEADPTECAALARRAGLVAVESLATDLHVRKVEISRVVVKGVLHARVVQACVVTLDPFETEIASEIQVDFADPTEADLVSARAPADRDAGKRWSVEIDAPDPIIEGRIDLGSLAAEFLMLALDPYPRKPGVSFGEKGIAGDDAAVVSPFAVLRKHSGLSRGED